MQKHLFMKNISLSLQKLRHYNKNLTKHQTKINTAIIARRGFRVSHVSRDDLLLFSIISTAREQTHKALFLQ